MHAGDLAGFSVSSGGDINGDGYDDLLVGAPGESSSAELAGAAYVVYGPVSSPGGVAMSGFEISGEADGDYAGFTVSRAGDVNDDGYDDVLIGAVGRDADGARSGAVYLFSGPIDADLPVSAADARIDGIAADDGAGFAIAAAGDVNGDGYDDLLIGAPGEDGAGADAGAAHLLYGPVEGPIDLRTTGITLRGEAAGDLAGASLAGAGDVDGDGFDDLLIGAPGSDADGTSSGAAYLFYGPIDASASLSTADVRLTGEMTGAYAGASVSAAGDVNADGLADVLVGAPGNWAGANNSGAAYLMYGPLEAASQLGTTGVALYGELDHDFAGARVASAGDVNGDGFGDVLVSAPGQWVSGEYVGAAYLLYGPLEASQTLATAPAKLVGAPGRDYLDFRVRGAGDLDGDGLADLVVGAWLQDSAGSNAGAAWLLRSVGGR
jgi:hypothetical protein